MVKSPYVPEAGDLVWVSRETEVPNQQGERRPALVITSAEYNRASGLALACSVTSEPKGYPFEVPVSGKRLGGAILADRIRTLEWRMRDLTFIERADERLVSRVKELVAVLLELT